MYREYGNVRLLNETRYNRSDNGIACFKAAWYYFLERSLNM